LRFSRQVHSKRSKKPRTRFVPSTPFFRQSRGAKKVYNSLYALYRKLYFAFGLPDDATFGDVLPKLMELAQNADSVR
jgi:hypothetical protein